MGVVNSQHGGLGVDHNLEELNNTVLGDALIFFESTGRPISQWPLSDEMKRVVEKEPIENVLDLEDEAGIIVDRFADPDSRVFVEVTRNLLGSNFTHSDGRSMRHLFDPKDKTLVAAQLKESKAIYMVRVFKDEGYCMTLTVNSND